MLCLTRMPARERPIKAAPESRIHIGDVVVAILKAHNGQVRLGIVAPQEIRVLRGEHADAEETKTHATDWRMGQAITPKPSDRRHFYRGRVASVVSVHPDGHAGIFDTDGVLLIELEAGERLFTGAGEWVTA